MAVKKPPEFHPTQRLQHNFERGIRAITGRVLLRKKPEQTLEQWLASLAARSQEPDIQAASKRLAERMVGHINIVNARTWREAANRTQQSQRLHKLLQQEMQGAVGHRVRQLVSENAALISSVSTTAAQTLVHEVMTAQQNGARPATVGKMLRKRFPELLRSRTNLISRTETAKASTALTQARCEHLNLQWYQWETSQDRRTRLSHKNMNGVLVPWSQAPSPEALVGEKDYGHYHCGETFNCRCTTIPILTLDDVRFPVRVYWQGRISTMTKRQFRSIAVGLE